MDADLPLKELQGIAEDLFGSQAWTVDGTRAWANMPCPGESHHTKREKNARACRIYLGGNKPPSIYCTHTSCSGEVEAANFRLRSEIGRAKSEERRAKSQEEQESRRREWLKKQERKRAAAERPRLEVREPGGDGRWKIGDGRSEMEDRACADPCDPGESLAQSGESETQNGEIRTVRMDAFKAWEEGVRAAKTPPKDEGRRLKVEIKSSPTRVRGKAVVMTAVFPRSGKIFRSIYQDGQHRLTDYLGEEWGKKDEG